MEWNSPHANTLCFLIVWLLLVAAFMLNITHNGGIKWEELQHPTTQSHCSLK